jgi:aryl-alcohol dehydrogenase-like predicted oxidoreductase
LLRERVSQAAGLPFEQIPADAPLPVTHETDFSPEYLRFAVVRSLRRLRTDYIDLLQLHNPPLQLIGRTETYAVLEGMKREGLIRWYGVSVHLPEEGLAAIAATMPDTVQIAYNLARREAAAELFPAARAANVGVIVREPLANGFLAGRYSPDSRWEPGDIRGRMPAGHVAQLAALGRRVAGLAEKTGCTAAQLALKFALDDPTVSTAIAGMKTVQQVDDNLSVET